MSQSPSLKRQKLSKNEYSGYIIKPEDKIDEISKDITPIEFFNEYIKPRKPVKFNKEYSQNAQTTNEILSNLSKFKFNVLLNTLNYDEELQLQVEEKFDGGFGLGKKRINMNIIEIFDELKSGDRDLYLTTQYKVGDHDVNDVDEEAKILDEEDEEEDDEEEDQQVMYENMSNASSIDMNNLKDDFDEFDEEGDGEVVEEEDGINLEKEIEHKQRIEELYQPPLTNLANSSILPTNPSLIPNLITQQINLWMGKISTTTKFEINSSKPIESLDRSIPSNGTSSGLHHDHADNLYILIQGHKKFTIYSPNDAEKLFTVGDIFKIYHNGLIDYNSDKNLEGSIRDDGALLGEILYWKRSKAEDPKEIEQLDKLIDKHEEEQKSIREQKSTEEASSAKDPPSFSNIPPALLHLDGIKDPKIKEQLMEFSNKHFPGFLNLNKMSVSLYPGEMLYLPAGWFHEVSSYGDIVKEQQNTIEQINEESSNIHIALNYWFVPPNNMDFNKPYKDSYWKEDWEVTKKALDGLGKNNMHS
ncbi:hypothetical protein KGF54_000994 [Candida jiufengensis]|uniref:uncharacterized protein n=1 Tax=Candida jiufengensis TaxID=497108 RepID=UPI0022245C43|nr:uncharacterized protein KGF54_000994 [Candida jiufengensis]KAI5956519.1 hypothetical protein KGF54_000994 [Candida jiufengensis]